MLNAYLIMPRGVQQKTREPEGPSFNNMNTKSGTNQTLCALGSDAREWGLNPEGDLMGSGRGSYQKVQGRDQADGEGKQVIS